MTSALAVGLLAAMSAGCCIGFFLGVYASWRAMRRGFLIMGMNERAAEEHVIAIVRGDAARFRPGK